MFPYVIKLLEDGSLFVVYVVVVVVFVGVYGRNHILCSLAKMLTTAVAI